MKWHGWKPDESFRAAAEKLSLSPQLLAGVVGGGLIGWWLTNRFLLRQPNAVGPFGPRGAMFVILREKDGTRVLDDLDEASQEALLPQWEANEVVELRARRLP